MSLIKKILVVIIVVTGQIVTAQTTRTIELPTKTVKLPFEIIMHVPAYKPLIGLALSGGGARGFAQIGVLKAFEEAGINIYAISGTSIGSIVGGLYALGYSATELDSIVCSTDWEELLDITGSASRRELFIDQKISEDRSIFTLRLDGFRPVIPTSFNEGLRLSNYLTLLSLKAPLSGISDFDGLLMKYGAVCTDLIKGRSVVLKSGSISQVMRASSSVTFFLAPTQIDSMILVDGGLISNIPVDVVRDLSADYIIAVNTTSPLHNEEELSVPWNIADQTVSIPMKQLENQQLGKANFVISPDLKNFSTVSFNSPDSLISLGYESALPLINKIKLSLDSVYKSRLEVEETFLKNIKTSGLPDDLKIKYQQKYSAKDSVSTLEIAADLAVIFDSGDFKSIKAKINQAEYFSVIDFIYEYNPAIDSVIISLEGVETDSLMVTEIQKHIKSRIGNNKPFNAYKTVQAILNTVKSYKNRGYLLFGCDSVQFNEEANRLRIFFSNDKISKVKISGSSNQSIVERELNIKPGDELLFDNVQQSLNGLRSTGLFEDINIGVGRTVDSTNLNVSVREKISSLLKVGFLVDNVYNFQLGLDFRDINVFSTGTELGLFLFGGTSNRAYILEHIAHRILKSSLTYKASAYYKFNDIKVYKQETSPSGNTFQSIDLGKYRQIFYGLSLSLGTQLEKFGKLIFIGKYQFDEVKNSQGSPVNPYKTKIVSLRISSTIDNQNKYPFPEDGLYFNGFYETAQSFLGGDESYLLFNADLKYYLQVASDHVLSPRLQIGFGDKTVPLSEQFLLGGQYSFFGAHENEFRGRQIFLASLMYQYKLPFKIFFDTYFWFRYDLGSTWAVQEQIRFKDLRHGIGGSISFDSPIGPMDFSVGRSFIVSQGLKEGSFVWGDVLFYFSIGHAVSF